MIFFSSERFDDLEEIKPSYILSRIHWRVLNKMGVFGKVLMRD
jgi:hypothetical protein